MAGPVSPARRARAARVRRQGGTQKLAADAARVDVSTVQRWEKTPGFQDMLHSRGVLQAGPLKILADDSAALDVWGAKTRVHRDNAPICRRNRICASLDVQKEPSLGTHGSDTP